MSIKLNDEILTKTWVEKTKGIHTKGADINKGMFGFRKVRDRIPALIFHINSSKAEKQFTPWRDLVYQEDGTIIYYGDNKDANNKADKTQGNKKVLEILKLYFSNDQAERQIAPPIIVTQHVKKNNKTYRKFLGYGIIDKNPQLCQQYERNSNGDKLFSNYRFEITLLKLNTNDEFEWGWIDDRRNSNVQNNNANDRAPDSWKEWVRSGKDCINNVKLKIRSYNVVSKIDQMTLTSPQKQIIKELLETYYPNPTRDGVRFEALASFITELFFKQYNYVRGWITKGTGDRGVDFVGRLDIGSGFSKTSIIVLGQSKRYKNAISGEMVTRVASRMTRGYIGVVVTLNAFNEATQAEIIDDKLPIILINAKAVSELLLEHMNQTGKNLADIVNEQDQWAQVNIGDLHYERILNSV